MKDESVSIVEQFQLPSGGEMELDITFAMPVDSITR
jgi:hypothetical protein